MVKRFLPKVAQYQALLNALLSALKTRESQNVMQSPETVEASETTKQQLVDATRLAFPQQDTLLAVLVDVSGIAVGTALHQMSN